MLRLHELVSFFLDLFDGLVRFFVCFLDLCVALLHLFVDLLCDFSLFLALELELLRLELGVVDLFLLFLLFLQLLALFVRQLLALIVLLLRVCRCRGG